MAIIFRKFPGIFRKSADRQRRGKQCGRVEYAGVRWIGIHQLPGRPGMGNVHHDRSTSWQRNGNFNRWKGNGQQKAPG